jgi:hypothetical protein
MYGIRDKRIGALRRGALALALALIAFGLSAGTALAAQDALKGGSVVMQLRGSKGLKLKPSTLALPITGGAIDPVDGSGTANTTGAIKARKGKDKAKVQITSVTFGANGGAGRISAKIGKRKVSNFGTLVGGTTTRDGWGADIGGVTAKLSAKGAKALGFKGVKGGTSLGSVSAKTVPATVAVVPGSGEIVLTTNALGSFVQKLTPHCIDPLPTGSPAGVAPIAPATTSGVGGTVYHFPVSGGAVAPDFSGGDLIAGGGQTITKNSSSVPPPLGEPASCASSAPAVGTKLVSQNPRVQFGLNAFASDTTLPDGFQLLAALGNIDFSTGTRSIDPNTKALTVTGATVSLAPLTAANLNQIFPNQSGNAANDFSTSDVLGTVDIVGAKLR